MTIWFDRKPGDFVSLDSEEGKTLLIGDAPPDWARQPPEIGGRTLRVLGTHMAPCPMCQSEYPVRHLELEDRYGVAECFTDGFVWYRKHEETTP